MHRNIEYIHKRVFACGKVGNLWSQGVIMYPMLLIHLPEMKPFPYLLAFYFSESFFFTHKLSGRDGMNLLSTLAII